MNLKHLLKQSWQMVWKNPYLWLFGFFAALFANNEVSLIITNFKRINDWINSLVTFRIIQIQFQRVLDVLGASNPVSPRALFNLTLSAVIILFFFWLVFLSQIGLIYSAKYFRAKKPLAFAEVFQKSKKFFWPVLSINVLSFVITYGLLILLGMPFLYRTSSPIIAYIIVFILIGIFISFTARFALCFIVLEKEKFLLSIKKGALFFLTNWLITVKTSISLFLITILVGLGILLIGIGTSVPLLVFASILFHLNLSLVFWIIFVFWILILAIILLVIGSVFSSFQFMVWAFLFLELRSPLDGKLVE